MSQTVFTMDGIAYNVSVTSLERNFSVMDTDKSGRTMDGAMYTISWVHSLTIL